ncbi:probable beta-tubulin polyglutamylase [Teleopsis dalmanni]|uniref:probable beta-tubulin polyglutamylase n=1 Tax=Teleopsis dalmanni TaxID=139649 RepID=UPI0018CE100C|nr:probable beta-tubulin polyglutamylase [Teleopsis dalmanni]
MAHRDRFLKKAKFIKDDEIIKSRNKFIRSRIRVENLKKVLLSKRNSETEVVDSEWVASGKLGTRDAVLKFRTNILNSDISATSEIQDSNSDNNAADSKNPVSGSSTTPQLFDGRGRSNSIVTKSAKESAESEDTEADLNESGDFQCDSEYSNHEADEGNIDLPYSRTMPAHVLKITYKFMQTETRLIRKIFNRHGLTEVQKDENFSILWTGVHIKPDILRNLAPYQRVNHFPRSYELTRKDRLYKNIVHLQHLHGFRMYFLAQQRNPIVKDEEGEQAARMTNSCVELQKGLSLCRMPHCFKLRMSTNLAFVLAAAGRGHVEAVGEVFFPIVTRFPNSILLQK